MLGYALVVFLFLAQALPESARTISVMVTTSSGQTLHGVKVSLARVPGQVISQAFTDSRGLVDFTGIYSGTYQIVVSEAGYLEASLPVEVTRGSPTVIHVNVFLERKAAKDEKSGGARSVSLSQLQRKIPPEAQKEYERGVKDSLAGKLESAIKRLNKAIQLYPDYAEAHNNLGAQYLKLGRPDEALQHIERALKIDPTLSLAYVNLGIIYNQKRLYSQAAEALERGVNLAEDSALAHLQLGYAYLHLGNLDAAEAHLRKSYRLDPRSMSQARLHIADIYLKRGQPQAAIAELEAYLEENPGSPGNERIDKIINEIKRDVR